MDSDTENVRPIVALPIEVVNKIAAGEVVVRPLNAVKELVENALDAGATEIAITSRNGGLDLIKVKDNGCGINPADYAKLCERFSTSKLCTVEDLQKVSTFGFRGEALASISCVAKVSVVSRRPTDAHAWTVAYKDCIPLSFVSPSAGLHGTQIVVENLYADYPQRRSAFSRPQEESIGIANMLVKYAINFPREDGGCKTGCFRSPGSGDQHETIRQLVPSKLAKQLLDFEVEDQRLKFSANVCMAAPLSSHTSTAIKAKNEKQRIFQLFINSRLVSCAKLKQSIDTIFAARDAYCPFMTMSLKIDPARMDVNVHPTKEMVCFLDEAQIIELLENKVCAMMESFSERGVVDITETTRATTSRGFMNDSFELQPLNEPLTQPRQMHNIRVAPDMADRIREGRASMGCLTSFINQTSTAQIRTQTASTPPPNSSKNPKTFIRVDAKNRRLDEYVSQTQNESFIFETSGDLDFIEPLDETSPLNSTVREEISQPDDHSSPAREIGTQKSTQLGDESSLIDLESLDHRIGFQPLGMDSKSVCRGLLLKEILNEEDSELTLLIRSSTFIGFVDATRINIQTDNRVFIINYIAALEEMFYQKYLRSMGNLRGGRLLINQENNGLSFLALVENYLEQHPDVRLPNEENSESRDDAVDELVGTVCEEDNLRLLWEEFGIFIDTREVGYPRLSAILAIVDGYVPLFSNQLSAFAYQLITANWSDESTLLKQITKAIAHLWTPYSLPECEEEIFEEQIDLIEQKLFPILKAELSVPNKLQNQFAEMLSTAQAFKIFGRC